MHALYRELVGTGEMTDREFHDAFLKENCIPIPTLRAILQETPLDTDFASGWQFLTIAGPETNAKKE
ncbi:MAG: hypothetical protein EOO38_16665 [Cytophagaceae bacterium]|nr:MAG: hypothetical protein EOO38_16665 [Cytophagaceae bacterium]